MSSTGQSRRVGVDFVQGRQWPELTGDYRSERRRMKMQLLTPPETQIIRMTPTYESNTPALFKCWEEISTRVRAAKEIQIFLDFDGTLVPYTPRPNQVRLEGSTEA